MTLRTKLSPVAVALALAFSSASYSDAVCAASVQQRLNEAFGAMSNVTKPGVFEGQRRGVLSGGEVQIRSPIMDVQLYSITPPSYDAGCGGIDLYLGSFSFINKEQFLQLLRSIAANAAGYAFKIALQVGCPLCDQTISELQKLIQNLNIDSLNSCQLAQGIVTSGQKAIQTAMNSNMSLENVAKGLVDDAVSGIRGLYGKSPAETQKESGDSNSIFKNDYQGNLVWKMLKAADASRWFGSSDKSMNEAMMSITGSIIYEEPTSSTTLSGKDGETREDIAIPTTPLPGNLLTLEMLVKGTKESDNVDGKKVYVCQNDDCTIWSQANPNLEGLAKKIEKVLVGSDGKTGILFKLGNYYPESAVTEEEKNVLASLGVAGSMLRNLAVVSYGTARDFAPEVAQAAALHIAYNQIKQMLYAIQVASAKLKQHPEYETIMGMIKDANNTVETDYSALLQTIGTLDRFYSRYGSIMALAMLPAVVTPDEARQPKDKL